MAMLAETNIKWDQVGERFYETGVKRGVLYVYDTETKEYGEGVAWNGLVSISESPSGAESTPLYADDTKYLNLMSAEEFGATIEAYTYPEEFEACDGSAELVAGGGVTIGQQARKSFGLSYVTTRGNDTENNEYGYKIHIIYGCMASPSEKAYQTINDSPEAITFSWEVKTTPVTVDGFKPTATLIIDSKKTAPEKLAKIEELIWGKGETKGTLPMPSQIVTILQQSA